MKSSTFEPGLICVFAVRKLRYLFYTRLTRYRVNCKCWDMLDVWSYTLVAGRFYFVIPPKNVKNVINRFYRSELKTDVVLSCTVC